MSLGLYNARKSRVPSRPYHFTHNVLLFVSRWCACLYSPIVLRQSPTPRSVDDDKYWFVPLRRWLSSSSDACNSMVSRPCFQSQSVSATRGMIIERCERAFSFGSCCSCHDPTFGCFPLEWTSRFAFSHSRNHDLTPCLLRRW